MKKNKIVFATFSCSQMITFVSVIVQHTIWAHFQFLSLNGLFQKQIVYLSCFTLSVVPNFIFFWTQFSQTALCLGHNFLSQVSPITVFNQKMNIAIPFKLEERGMRKIAQSENISHKDWVDTQNPGS